MKKLINFIQDNKEKFDENEPSIGHFDKFRKELEKQDRIRKNKQLFFVLKIAAIFILFLGVGIIFVKTKESYTKKVVTNVQKSNFLPEYVETENYYKIKFENKLLELEKLKCTNGVQQKDSVLYDFKEIDESFKKLKIDLKQNPNNDRIIHAMISHYEIKIEILNIVLNELKKEC